MAGQKVTSPPRLQRTRLPALHLTPVKVMRESNTIPKGSWLAGSDDSSLVAWKSQAGPGSPAEVSASITFNKIAQQVGIVSQL